MYKLYKYINKQRYDVKFILPHYGYSSTSKHPLTNLLTQICSKSL